MGDREGGGRIQLILILAKLVDELTQDQVQWLTLVLATLKKQVLPPTA
jgi:hypothetical protein